MDSGRLFRRGHRDPAPTDVVATRVRAVLTRLTRVVPGDVMLHPPASEADITATEAHLGQRLPEDVRALYRLHDGQHQYTPQEPRFAAGLFAGLAMLPLADVAVQWDQWDGYEQQEEMDEFASSTPEGFVQPKYSARGWIPLTHDGSGNHIGVDLDPGPAGTVGQVIMFGADDDEHQVLAPSLTSYLEQVADLIASGDITPTGEPDWVFSRPQSQLFHPTGPDVA
ncbi:MULTISPECIES: SMI1/KNR4 family protein [Curtobacterium]|uniref:SMI1/KNR4 family protein n=1 Tax=Curtobacterium flaccumfaciens TaxID=2035 RepID=UPI003EE68412